jgi:hypothetical protein
MNIISLILITVGLFILLFIWITSETKCKERVVVKYMCPNKSILDVQFSEDNNPSKIYSDLFQKPSPWVGGFSLENGKTFTLENKKK